MPQQTLTVCCLLSQCELEVLTTVWVKSETGTTLRALHLMCVDDYFWSY